MAGCGGAPWVDARSPRRCTSYWPAGLDPNDDTRLPDGSRWDVAREQGREIATRAIVAVATVRPHADDDKGHAFEIGEHTGMMWRPCGDYALPPWADPYARHWWALSEVVALANPVPVPRGQLGLWTLDPEIEAAVRREEDACR